MTEMTENLFHKTIIEIGERRLVNKISIPRSLEVNLIIFVYYFSLQRACTELIKYSIICLNFKAANGQVNYN
jgi:hypothetical protein